MRSPLVLAPLLLVACGGAATTRPAGTPKAATAPKATATITVTTPEQNGEKAERALLQNLAQLSPPNGPLGPEAFSFSRGRRDGSVARTQVEPVSFRVADLPLANLGEPLSSGLPPYALPAGDDVTELLLDWRGADEAKVKGTWTTVRVSLKGTSLGRIRIGTNEAPVSTGGNGGVYVTCGGEATSSRTVISPARWEMLSAAGGGVARYTVVDGWFDARTCKAVEVRRTSVEARALAGGLLYGFREACSVTAPKSPTGAGNKATPIPAPAPPACAGESLTVLGPRLQHVVASGVGGDARTILGNFSRVTLPLRKGGGGSLVERIAATSVREWREAAGSRASFTQDVLLGIEVVQSVDDPEPIAVAYVSEG